MPVRLVEKQLISGPNQSDRGFGSNCTIYYCVQFGFRDPERRVPQGHPIRRIKQLADAALEKLSPLFDQMCSTIGRLLKASLLMALYTVSSERMLCERLNYDVGLNQLARESVAESSKTSAMPARQTPKAPFEEFGAQSIV